MEIRKIKNHEEFDLTKIGHICFSVPGQKDVDKEAFVSRMKSEDASWNPDAEKTGDYAAFTGGYMVGAVLTPEYTVYFDGGQYNMRGIGGVCALPAYRKQGVVRGIMERVLRDIYNDGAVFSVLYPFSFDFYRKMGYECALAMTTYDVKITACPEGDFGGSFILCETRAHFNDAAAVYSTYAERSALAAVRNDSRWDAIFTKKPSVDGITTYIWKDNDGKPRAYITYEIGKNEGEMFLDVKELCFTDSTALRALISFVRGSFLGFYGFMRITVPAGADIRFLFTEHNSIKGTTNFRGMTRIVNVKKTFEAVKAKGFGVAYIEVTDRQIPENNGCWRVESGEGGIKAEKADGVNPCMSAPVCALSAMLTGVIDFEHVDFFPAVTVNGNRDMLSGLFCSRTNFLYEYF
ncbi:MAG: GNAT family N-acetyltransferase [Defluviitaleaceae bacterium]|nr:GNAT family N-acetyltransferase [Defluviitaleaceae bacterium]MCL2835507.1 GNAT family N-acetyltransferase [Defluviitaleaceae bacterium]